MFQAYQTPNDYSAKGCDLYDMPSYSVQPLSLRAMLSSTMRPHLRQFEFDDFHDDIEPVTETAQFIPLRFDASIYRDIEDILEADMKPHQDLVQSNLEPSGLRTFDVVCGRNRMAHSHRGNKHFRRLVKEYSSAYQGAKLREEKKCITMSIIDTIHRFGGRFLKLDETDDEAGFANVEEASAEYQYEKVSHALRSNSKAPRQHRRLSHASSTTSTSQSGSSVVSITDHDDDEFLEPFLGTSKMDDFEPIWNPEELNFRDIDLHLLFRL